MALLPTEAVPARRLTFALGREAARRAFAKLSRETKPILRSPDGSPQWPEGFVGSISHTDELAVAAMSRVEQTAALGLDLEDLRREIPDDIVASIADDHERLWISGDHEKLLRVFSAKEAVFKAFSAQAGTLFGFEAAHLEWIGSGFLATVLIHGTESPVSGHCVVRSQRREHLLLSSVFRPPFA
jgi:enterobactin synthetase component D